MPRRGRRGGAWAACVRAFLWLGRSLRSAAQTGARQPCACCPSYLPTSYLPRVGRGMRKDTRRRVRTATLTLTQTGCCTGALCAAGSRARARRGAVAKWVRSRGQPKRAERSAPLSTGVRVEPPSNALRRRGRAVCASPHQAVGLLSPRRSLASGGGVIGEGYETTGANPNPNPDSSRLCCRGAVCAAGARARARRGAAAAWVRVAATPSPMCSTCLPGGFVGGGELCTQG